MSVLPVASVDAASLLDRATMAQSALPPSLPPSTPIGPSSFSQMLTDGINRVNSDVLQANSMVRAFALDDSIPVHQVTFALEQARLSLEMMMQIRSRLVEGYQQLMNMQL